MSLQALIAVRSHKTVSFLPHLFSVEDEDEPGRRVAGRRAAFHFERLARLVRGSKATEGGSFLGGDRQAHVRLAEDREEIRPLRGHLTPVQPNKVHLHCRVQIVSNYFSKKCFSFLFLFFFLELIIGFGSFLIELILEIVLILLIQVMNLNNCIFA